MSTLRSASLRLFVFGSAIAASARGGSDSDFSKPVQFEARDGTVGHYSTGTPTPIELAFDPNFYLRTGGVVLIRTFRTDADTVVILDGNVLGKPANRDEAAAFLRRLGGRSHEVRTAVSLAFGMPGAPTVKSVTSITQVHMREIQSEPRARACPRR